MFFAASLGSDCIKLIAVCNISGRSHKILHAAPLSHFVSERVKEKLKSGKTLGVRSYQERPGKAVSTITAMIMTKANYKETCDC